MVALLPDLLKGKPKNIQLLALTKAAFKEIKGLFATAPILKLPNPTKPVVVKVDVSEIGLGVLLS